MLYLRHIVLLASLLLSAAPHALSAQQVTTVRVQLDNDNFLFWLPRHERPDHEYTHGTRVTITTAAATGWGPLLALGAEPCEGGEPDTHGCLQTVWEVGQRIYTPRTNSAQVVAQERPHAGWLYGAATAVVQRAVDRHALRLEAGVTGPPSLAEFMQVRVHRLGGYWTPRGWKHQIGFEPGLLVGYGYDRVLAAPAVNGVRVAELTSEVGVSAGTVVTGGGAGLNTKIGFNVPQFWREEAPGPHPRLAVYLTAGARADGYIRNLFLDGNTFRDGHRVAKLPSVVRYHMGAVVRVDQLQVGYEVVSRTREYRTEPGGHRFGSVSVTYQPGNRAR